MILILLAINVVATQYDVHFRIGRFAKKLEAEGITEETVHMRAEGKDDLLHQLLKDASYYLSPYILSTTNIVAMVDDCLLIHVIVQLSNQSFDYETRPSMIA